MERSGSSAERHKFDDSCGFLRRSAPRGGADVEENRATQQLTFSLLFLFLFATAHNLPHAPHMNRPPQPRSIAYICPRAVAHPARVDTPPHLTARTHLLELDGLLFCITSFRLQRDNVSYRRRRLERRGILPALAICEGHNVLELHLAAGNFGANLAAAQLHRDLRHPKCNPLGRAGPEALLYAHYHVVVPSANVLGGRSRPAGRGCPPGLPGEQRGGRCLAEQGGGRCLAAKRSAAIGKRRLRPFSQTLEGA